MMDTTLLSRSSSTPSNTTCRSAQEKRTHGVFIVLVVIAASFAAGTLADCGYTQRKSTQACAIRFQIWIWSGIRVGQVRGGVGDGFHLWPTLLVPTRVKRRRRALRHGVTSPSRTTTSSCISFVCAGTSSSCVERAQFVRYEAEQFSAVKNTTFTTKPFQKRPRVVGHKARCATSN
ncbi:hypothetical protein H310_09298 [Aphanomyces invadans]|uniref:Uncharacterized protein n=1 Tax=Aphanomyces invadans TaxID=157072 RepID=A0A024TV04_9STRA|nr:hypothetical protein H310_09298 [Aphanomyces invadans]ETV97995.1 hypothetical protein H310_09298 [Aphanomyces invadans]|eukprot:XP_008873556.1 hypothetical protein H310_09298 [Aphanomyces invadans]